MKKLKEVEESSIMDSLSVQGQLTEEERKAIERMNEAMQQVFGISLVVQDIILDKLELVDLETCRHVSSAWKEMVTKVILKKDCSQVNVTYDFDTGKFSKGDLQQVQGTHHVTELTKIIEKSNPFPSSTFIIHEGNLEDPDILSFFKVGGGDIKSLDFGLEINSLEVFHEILEVHCPNVETLRLHSLLMVGTMTPIELPKLKVFASTRLSEFRFRYFICRNLQLLEDFDLIEDTMDVVKAGKIHTVKKLELGSIPKYNPPEKLQEFVSAGPQIDRVTLYGHSKYLDEMWRRDFAGPLQQLLDLSRDTLKFMEFSGLGYLFPSLEFPRFSKLRELRIIYCVESKRLFPIRINLPETFPKLEVLDTISDLSEDANWDKYFPPPDAYRGQLTRVKKVRVRGRCTQKCREMFGLLCPNAIFVE